MQILRLSRCAASDMVQSDSEKGLDRNPDPFENEDCRTLF